MEKLVTRILGCTYSTHITSKTKREAMKSSRRRGVWCFFTVSDYLNQVLRSLENLSINSKYEYKNLRNVQAKRESEHTVLCLS